MKLHGTLSKWNDDRGFGFITPAEGGVEVFVHVSAFPRDGERPRIGETLGFEVETGPDGRKRAIALTRPQQAPRAQPGPRPPPRARDRSRRSPLGHVLPLVVIVALVFGYDRYSGQIADWVSPSPTNALTTRMPAAVSPPARTYRCDGRTHCSQMTSCEEATYFLRNCPGTKMDGNNDGVPCEMQWCGG